MDSDKKIQISIIDFMLQHGKYPVGKDSKGETVCYGDMVRKNNENWFVAYRYGKIMLKQVGFMAMLTNEGFEKGDFSSVEKLNVFGAGSDWLIIGYTDEPFIKKLIEDKVISFTKES